MSDRVLEYLLTRDPAVVYACAALLGLVVGLAEVRMWRRTGRS